MFARGSPRVLHFSLASFSLPRTVESYLSLLSHSSLLHPRERRTHCGLVRGSGGTKELVNGFIWIRSSPYLSHPPGGTSLSSAFYLVFADLLVLIPTSFQSLPYRVVTELLIRRRRGEWNKKRWNESLGKRQRRRSLKMLIGKLIRRICQDRTEA